MFFDRKKYKKFALIQLKGRWGVPVLITITIWLITSLFQIPDLVRVFKNQDFWNLVYSEYSDFQSFFIAYNTALDSISSKGSTLLSIIQLIVGAILEVAAISVYLRMSRSPEKVSFSLFIEGLNSWGRAILAALWKFLWVYLWALLFIIPGIIKAIAYSQMFYLINEYPDMSIPKSMNISKVITRGHKGELFAMYLSFIGWALLACLTCGIGMIWLKPYFRMTTVNAYHALMKDALETGLIRPEDLQNEKRV